MASLLSQGTHDCSNQCHRLLFFPPALLKSTSNRAEISILQPCTVTSTAPCSSLQGVHVCMCTSGRVKSTFLHLCIHAGDRRTHVNIWMGYVFGFSLFCRFIFVFSLKNEKKKNRSHLNIMRNSL